MNKFGLVFKHYFMRLMKDKLGLALQIILPLFIILFMLSMPDEDYPYVGQAWAIAISNYVISFSLFGGQWAMGYIFDDLKETRKWRLLATPVDEGLFRRAAMLASMLISFTNSVIIITVATIARPVEWNNLWLLIGILILTILLSHSFCYFLTIVMKDYKSANGLSNFILMGLAIIGGGIIMGIQNLVNLDAFTFIHDYVTPLSMGRQAILHGGIGGAFIDGELIIGLTDWSIVMLNVGLLLGLTMLFAVASSVMRRRKNHDHV